MKGKICDPYMGTLGGIRVKGQMSEFNHNGQQENLMQIFMSDHRELFGLVKNYDSPFFLFVLLFVCCAIMFIFFM